MSTVYTWDVFSTLGGYGSCAVRRHELTTNPIVVTEYERRLIVQEIDQILGVAPHPRREGTPGSTL